jgi:outer membrane protein assembly factor BamA
VLVGEIHPSGVPAAPDPKVVDALAKLSGTDYSVGDSPGVIEARLGDYYRDKGYLEAEVHAAAQADPVIAPEAVRVSFQVTASPGIRYKLSGIQLAPGLLLSQAEFDRQAQIPSGVFAVSVYVRDSWSFIESQYHNRGFLEAAAHPTPIFDRTQGTVRFTVTVDPGPVYIMGKLTIQNTADDLRAALLAPWKLPGGAVFNEGAMKSFYANLPPNSPLARTMTIADLKYTMQLNHETHTVDVTLRLERKP